jgi:hypothetical protein
MAPIHAHERNGAVARKRGGMPERLLQKTGECFDRHFADAHGEFAVADATQPCHMPIVLKTGQAVFSELKNLCVWNKTNGGMGTFYRSKHELVFVFKVGTAAHTNTFGLGDSGRYRSNVWDFAGVNTLRAGRSEDLAMHPTVKPVALVAEAIKDCSKRGEIVLDPFGGSGTTLIAAEKTGRLARLIEFDPAYCDTVVRRFERVTGKQATHSASDLSFEEVAQERAAPPTAAEE